jgi:hypothetical protein
LSFFAFSTLPSEIELRASHTITLGVLLHLHEPAKRSVKTA